MKNRDGKYLFLLSIICLLALSASIANAGGSWSSCTRTTSEGGWAAYAGKTSCGTIWVGWGSNGTDRARWSTYDAGVRRDMYFTYRHQFDRRTNGDTSADHWSYAEGSYSGNVPVSQAGSTVLNHTINARASYDWNDWMEVGSDGGGSMDTVADWAQFYPELDAVLAGRSVVSSMYMGNVYQWMYQMSNPASAWWSWNNSNDSFYHSAGVVEGPGWYAANKVNSAPGTAPGGTMTVYFNMRPTQTGSSNEDFQMIRNGTSWFGDKVESNSSMRTAVSVSRKAPGANDGWDSGHKKKGETVRFSIYGADTWGIGSSYGWDFDHNTLQGWTSVNNCTLTQEGGSQLKIAVTGNDPHCHSSGGLAINTSNCKYMSIRMKANGGSDSQFFWQGSAGGWHGDRHVDWNIYPDNQWHVYTVKLPASWTGTVTQVRLDPVGTGAANGQVVYVDWLRIHNANAGMSAKGWLGTANNNWNIYSDTALTWDATSNCWYKDYAITGNYPQTYYSAMHVYNNNSQHCDNDDDRRYGNNHRAYKVLNTAPSCTNSSYSGNGWCTTKTPALGWNYTDADSNAQSRYHVQVATDNGFNNKLVDTDLVASGSNSHTTSSLPEGQLYYRTRVMDGAYSNLAATYNGGYTLNSLGALSGDSNKSVEFNGTTGYVQLPNGFDSFGGGFTCEFWAYPTAVNSWARFIDFGNGAPADNIVIARNSTTDTLVVHTYRGATNVGALSAAGAIALNTWQYFVVTIDSSGYGRIYKNGSLIAQGALPLPEVVSRTKCYIGKSNWAADALYKGRLDEFAIYDKCLSAAEISDHYSRASQAAPAYRDAVCASGPWAYYRFDEISGSSAAAYTGLLSGWSTGTGFRVDSIPPTTPTITNVSITGSSATVSFGGSTDANNFTYEVKLDNGAWTSQTSPVTFNSLVGAHTVYVRAIDEAGNTSGEASEPFTMDSTPPVINNVTSVAATNTSPIAVNYSVTDPDSGVKDVTLWVKKGAGGTWAATNLSSANASGVFNYTVSSEDTYYFAVVATDNADNATANPTGSGSTNTIYDTTDPSADLTVIPESQGAVNFLKGKITIEVNASDSASGVSKVEYKLDNGTYAEITGSGGFYTDDSIEIDDSWDNGQHTIWVRVTDAAGNYIELDEDFDVNKNEVSGLVSLQGMTLNVISRTVTFVLTYTDNNVDYKITKTVTPTFTSGKAFYSFTDIPDGVKSISAKTVWNLRKKMTLNPIKGQSTANFTAINHLPGGDLATPGAPKGDNVVNALDYAVLRAAWGYGAAGDITGDSLTDNNDYLIMQSNWYQKGDAE